MTLKLNRWHNTAQDRNFRNRTNDNWDQLENSHNTIEKISEQAKVDSQTAKEAAEGANKLSESVQTQLNEIVVNGDSSAEAAQARVDLKGVPHPTLKARVDSDAKKTVELEKKLSYLFVTPEMFGAKGDGVTDDFDAIQKMFDAAGSLVSFRQDATYIVRAFGIICNTSNLNIEGNNATIKLMDYSGLLDRMKNNTEKPGENICFWFNKDNVSIKNLNFHANADKNFFMHNDEKYYGYQNDLAVPGLPNKYITTYAVQSYVNNIKYKNCAFVDFGSSIFLGETWGNTKIVKDFVLDSCTFKSGFRDQVVFFQSRDIEIRNCYFYDNQRKAIQFYQNSSKQKVIGCEISVNVANIRKWHPKWSPSHADAELGGIGIQNINYYEDIYNCNDTEILRCKFIDTKFSISFRNYSKNLRVEDCTFENAGAGLILLNGLRGIVTFENNIIKNCDGINLILSRHESLNSTITANYDSFLNIKSNTLDTKGTLLTINDTNNQDLLYRKLMVLIEGNTIGKGANYLSLNSKRNSASYQFIELVQQNNSDEIREINFTQSSPAIRNIRAKGKYKISTPFIGEKPSQNHNFIKFMTLTTSSTFESVMLKGSIYNTNTNDAHYADYVTVIRSNSQPNWNSVIHSYIYNRMSTRPTDSIRIVEELNGSTRTIHMYLYVPNQEGQTVITIDNAEEISEKYKVAFPDSYPWLSSYQENGMVFVSSSLGEFRDINKGALSFSGDGSKTTLSIPHGLGVTPVSFNVMPNNLNAGNAEIKYLTADATYIHVYFKNAPIPGENNVRVIWTASPF
ncbi:hypothetical protein ACTFRP_08020 [Bacillus cereus group sp. MYBK234-1]|uniref:right-handed parallel beta-helix repeat-containing protein n=1 Tax=unclassified Bacillus cereus group TaxID=2750818 RepID=UPI003F7AB602